MATVVHVPVYQQMAAIPIIVRKSLFIYFAILRICLIEKKKTSLHYIKDDVVYGHMYVIHEKEDF